MIALALLAAAPVVATDAGRVSGVASEGRLTFRGIPFAKPPVGGLRWRAPQPMPRWSGLRAADRSAPACRQPDLGWNHQFAARQSEDCLYLDVVTPSLQPARLRPVMVWIHGGANWAGGAAGTVDSALGRSGIVLVSIQYRLGVFGFLSHPALSREQGGASGNYALMDQQAALRWVQHNIARFGGDPGNVTVFGESAGAQDVGLQQVSPGARGLFAKAIEESGTPQFGLPVRTLHQNEAIGERLTGLGAGAGAAALRAIPGNRLLAAQAVLTLPGIGDYLWLQATVDGQVLTEAPATTLAHGGGQRVPLVIGNNARELPPYGGNGPEAIVASAFSAHAADARAVYAAEPADDPVLGDRPTRIADDAVFRCPSDRVATLRAAHGVPVWRYQFSYRGADGKPVTHGSDLRYVMGAPAAGEPPLQHYWLNFARRGDPNGAGLPAWPAYRSEGGVYLDFAQHGPVVATGLRGPLCRWIATP